ncbi:MAG: AAA family ATPase, partial [bacterium]|nr:AAA family ATPase [bacterium]
TEEQIDAVALLALSLQKRFDTRPDKSSVHLPVATPTNNHRAIWLGGGGVGKTRTLGKIVQPLAETYFGPNGYSATAQSNQAAQNLGSRARTLHAANGLLLTDSLQTARLRLNAQTQKKMDRIAGDLGVEVIDELGAVPGDLLHADALRKTYGRALRHNLDSTHYMKPAETWGRMPCKILSGDFYQLPPVPASASLLASPSNQSYEHQQGRKLLLDMDYVHDFVEMRRFDDPLLIEILTAMRTPGGKKISEEAWHALQATVIQTSTPDPRLRNARGWYECAYEWRIVSYAMHAHARLNANAAGQLLYYIPSIDLPSARMSKEDFDAMRALPNISTTAKFPGILPVYIGMDMILTESFLPPRLVRGAPVQVVDIELHPKEPSVQGRPSIAVHGCVVLHFMPKCIYVRLRECKDVFLLPADNASQSSASDLTGILAVQPLTRQWKFKMKGSQNAVSVSR